MASLLSFSPSDRISIDLTSTETARTVIKCQNTSAAPVAFKVKTTAPKRYLVKPNQGVIAPGQSERIQIQVVPKERQLLNTRPTNDDRFMVLSVPAPDGLLRLDKESEAYTTEMAAAWTSASGSQQQSKFVVAFTNASGGGADATAAAPAQGERLREMLATKGVADKSPAKAAPGGGGAVGGSVASEVMTMRKKYDELVSYTVNLTAERDRLKNEMENMKKDLNKATLQRLASEKQDIEQVGKREAASRAKQRGGESDGFSLIQLLLVALVCFFLGRYLHSS